MTGFPGGFDPADRRVQFVDDPEMLTEVNRAAFYTDFDGARSWDATYRMIGGVGLDPNDRTMQSELTFLIKNVAGIATEFSSAGIRQGSSVGYLNSMYRNAAFISTKHHVSSQAQDLMIYYGDLHDLLVAADFDHSQALLIAETAETVTEANAIPMEQRDHIEQVFQVALTAMLTLGRAKKTGILRLLSDFDGDDDSEESEAMFDRAKLLGDTNDIYIGELNKRIIDSFRVGLAEWFPSL